MQRSRWKRRSVVGVVAFALLAASCGSDTKTVSAADFSDSLDSICRTTTRTVGDLDTSDAAGYIKDATDALETQVDAIGELKAPKAVTDDFSDYSDNLDDIVVSFKKASKALKADDTTGVTDAFTKLSKQIKTNDGLADDLNASRCSGILVTEDLSSVLVGVFIPITTDASTPGTVSTATTATPTVPPTVATVPPTVATAPPTVAPTQPTTVVTMPPGTAPPMTAPPPTGQPGTTGNLENYNPPTDYTWDSQTATSLAAAFTGPTNDPVLGPQLVAYGVEGATSGGTSVLVIVLEVSTPFTNDAINSYLAFEGVGNGTIVTTQLGLTAAEIGPSADRTFTTIVTFLQTQAVTIRVPAGGPDAGEVLDRFVDANTTGG